MVIKNTSLCTWGGILAAAQWVLLGVIMLLGWRFPVQCMRVFIKSILQFAMRVPAKAKPRRAEREATSQTFCVRLEFPASNPFLKEGRMCDHLYANSFSLSGWYSRFLPSLTQKGKLRIKLHYFSGGPSLASNKESKKYLDEESKTPFISLEMIPLHGWSQLGHGAVRSQGPLGATSESAVLWGGKVCVSSWPRLIPASAIVLLCDLVKSPSLSFLIFWLVNVPYDDLTFQPKQVWLSG